MIHPVTPVFSHALGHTSLRQRRGLTVLMFALCSALIFVVFLVMMFLNCRCVCEKSTFVCETRLRSMFQRRGKLLDSPFCLLAAVS